MKHRFPLNDVKVTEVKTARKAAKPLYADNFWQMNQCEFAMQVEGVGDFYACDGREVEYAPADGADLNSIELYLNGSVYGAILHQRKILPFHGSSFLYDSTAVMICGEAGAGKSSLTASFCLDGADFLTDDISPVIFKDSLPHIWALSDRIKLWSDTLRQLDKEKEELARIHPDTDKYFYPMEDAGGGIFRFNQTYIIEISDGNDVVIEELAGTDKFTALRGELYRPEYLKGMPENEPFYFRNLLDICNSVGIFRVKRHAKIRIKELKEHVKRHMAQG